MKLQKRRAGFAVGGLLIVGAFVYLVYGGIGSNLVFFLTPAELKAKGEQGFETPIRLAGQVVPGSIQWNAQALDLRFHLTDGTEKILVHSTKSPPQMFREGMGVVVEGKLNRSGIFESSNLMVKHSNEYRAPPEGMVKPREMYKSLVKDQSGE
jgi:cytochrome c-type biogenesis protein CcmE